MAEDIAGIEEPETSELLQEEPPFPVVPVEVRGTTRTTIVPAREGESRSLAVSNTVTEHLFGDDLRRQAVTFIAATNPIWVGTDRREVENGLAGILPVGVPLRIAHGKAWWARSTIAAGSILSYWTEQNAD